MMINGFNPAMSATAAINRASSYILNANPHPNRTKTVSNFSTKNQSGRINKKDFPNRRKRGASSEKVFNQNIYGEQQQPPNNYEEQKVPEVQSYDKEDNDDLDEDDNCVESIAKEKQIQGHSTDAGCGVKYTKVRMLKNDTEEFETE